MRFWFCVSNFQFFVRVAPLEFSGVGREVVLHVACVADVLADAGDFFHCNGKYKFAAPKLAKAKVGERKTVMETSKTLLGFHGNMDCIIR